MEHQYGLILKPIVPEAYIFGGERSINNRFGGEILMPNGDWRPTLANYIYSHQAPGYETNSCVTHGMLNAYELLLRRQYNRTHDFSDRFLATISGTDPSRGNDPDTVYEAFRTKFSVFETEWPTAAARNVAEFYAPISDFLKRLAAGRGVEWEVGHEWVNGKAAIKEALKYSPVCISAPAWSSDDNGEYYRREGKKDNHWVTLLHIDEQGRWHILDSYPGFNDPFRKILRADFEPTVAKRHHIKRQVVNEQSWIKYLINLIFGIKI